MLHETPILFLLTPGQGVSRVEDTINQDQLEIKSTLSGVATQVLYFQKKSLNGYFSRPSETDQYIYLHCHRDAVSGYVLEQLVVLLLRRKCFRICVGSIGVEPVRRIGVQM